MAAGRTGPRPAPPFTRSGPPQLARLGEELPVFCERCGYSLHGLPQTRCDACRVLHFNCPECGHHQPINTLRPAVQRALGRLRALGLAGIVFLKFNVLFWPLFGWAALGGETAYRYDYQTAQLSGRYELMRPPFQPEFAVFTLLFAALYAAVGRMLLLRWRRGWLVGMALCGFVVAAMVVGAYVQRWDYMDPGRPYLPHPLAPGFLAHVACVALGVVAGASVAWGVWLSLAHAFLPKRAAVALIAWQTAMSARDGRGGQSDAATSVTV